MAAPDDASNRAAPPRRPSRRHAALRLLGPLGLGAAVALVGADRGAALRPQAGAARPWPAQIATPTPDPRPNLVALRGQWLVRGRWRTLGRPELDSFNGRCTVGAGRVDVLRACVGNQGAAPSGPFAVAAEDAPGTALLAAGDLLPGEVLCASLDVAPGVAVLVDPEGTVDERREDDNRLAPLPVPSLPPIAIPTCAPRPTPRAELAGYGWDGFVDTQGLGCYLPGVHPVRGGVRVANDGELATGAFRVGGPADWQPDWRIPDLPPDGDRTLDDRRLASAGPLLVDADDDVPEHDEANNALNVIRATSPPVCTPDATPTPGPSDTPTPDGGTIAPPTATSSPTATAPDAGPPRFLPIAWRGRIP